MLNSIKIIENTNHDDVFIIFSSRNMPKGKFTLYDQLTKIKFPANMIFVNDYLNQYYLQGTPEFDNKLNFINFLLGQIHRLKRKYGKLFIFGASMGAYAALKYGSILQADKILALGVESKLGLPFGHSQESLVEKTNIKNTDISRLFYKSPQNVCIISGNDNIPDLYSASKMKENNPLLNILLINNYGHVVAKYIQAKDSLTLFILHFFTSYNDTIFNTLDTIKPPSVALSKTIKRINQDFNNIFNMDYKNDILILEERYPSWSRIQFYTAKIMLLENKKTKAKKHIKNAITNILDDLERTRLKLALLYFEKDMIEAGIEESQLLDNIGFSLQISKLLIQLYENKKPFHNE